MAQKPKPVKKVTPAKGATKKAAVKKVVAKPIAKKAAAKKAPVKKAAVKKAVAKKPIANKAAAKKPSVKKVAPQEAPEKKLSVNKKKVLVRKAVRPPSSIVQLPDATVEQAANINTGKPKMILPGNGQQAAQHLEKDPVTAFDQHVFNKVTSKGEPHSNMYLSSKPKNSLKPTGKKPLWRK